MKVMPSRVPDRVTWHRVFRIRAGHVRQEGRSTGMTAGLFSLREVNFVSVRQQTEDLVARRLMEAEPRGIARGFSRAPDFYTYRRPRAILLVRADGTEHHDRIPLPA